LETTLREARPDDLILVYFSGHGKQDFGGQLCLTTVNTRLSAHVATCRHS
jgi:uncharacterized caspase-like protein